MGRLDPVGLKELAVALDDGELRDVKIAGAKMVERCTVEGIIIRRDDEEVEVRQKGFIHRFPADMVMWVRPTAFEEEIAEEFEPPAVEGVVPTPEQIETLVLPKTMETVAFVWGDMKPHEILYGKTATFRGKHGNHETSFTRQRYATLRLLYEMTDLVTGEIPGKIGYRSPMAWNSCMHEVRGNHGAATAPEVIRNMVDQVRGGTGERWRRPESAGRDYCVCP